MNTTSTIHTPANTHDTSLHVDDTNVLSEQNSVSTAAKKQPRKPGSEPFLEHVQLGLTRIVLFPPDSKLDKFLCTLDLSPRHARF